METLNLSKKEFESLEDISINSSVYYAESKSLRIIDLNGGKYLLKEFNLDKTEMDNKLNVINSLDKYREYIPSKCIIPRFLVDIGNNTIIVGTNYIQGTNLSKIIDNPFISINDKKLYFKKIGLLLEEMKKIRNTTPLNDFYLGDMHEDNFIVDNKKEIFAIDIDSCKIMNSNSPLSKYLFIDGLISNSNKYEFEYNNPYIANYIVDENTDIYCYIIIILKYLYGPDINNISLVEYYRYLNYLDDIKVNPNLLECFNRIVSNEENKNPVDYIDTLTNKQIYLARKKYLKR